MQRSVSARDDTSLSDGAGDGPRGGAPASRVDGNELSFFCPDVTDARTLKRVQQFIDSGYRVTVFGFRRERYNTAYQPPWPNIPLGFTTDARYWHRIRALLRAIPALCAHRDVLKRATVFYARNIDQLLLALFARLISASRAPVAYEVLDIPPILMWRGPVPAFVRAIERLCLHRISLLVVSSPAFHWNYYAAVHKYRGGWFLLENKLHPSISSPPSAVRRAATRGRPWVVGYFGLIRGESTFALMTRLAERLQGRILFKFGGILTTVDQASTTRSCGAARTSSMAGPTCRSRISSTSIATSTSPGRSIWNTPTTILAG
jgi:succinoglycan biosynthesis protein ExoL